MVVVVVVMVVVVDVLLLHLRYLKHLSTTEPVVLRCTCTDSPDSPYANN